MKVRVQVMLGFKPGVKFPFYVASSGPWHTICNSVGMSISIANSKQNLGGCIPLRAS